eukprot:7117444-Alexandrium_andersonii.AAC.1
MGVLAVGMIRTTTSWRRLWTSGAGVSAAPPSFSGCAVGPVGFPEDRPWMQTVDGAGLGYYGRARLPFTTADNDGNLTQGQMQAEFTNIDGVVLSCGQMATLGTGSWFPPEDAQTYWLVDGDDEWLELLGPGLVRQGQLVPLEKKKKNG